MASRTARALHGGAVLLATGGLAWSAGFLYWHVRIERTLAELKAHPHPLHVTMKFREAGSRAFPYALRDLREEISGGRLDRAGRLSWELGFAIEAAERRPNSDAIVGSRFRRIFSDATLSDLREESEAYDAWWAAQRACYPPWWMWWKGRRLTSP